MCGIAGYIGGIIKNQTVLKKMTEAISHRGPDGEGHYYTKDFSFGHRRLAIVDLSDAGTVFVYGVQKNFANLRYRIQLS